MLRPRSLPMFFFAYPTSLAVRPTRTPVVSFPFFAVIAYRTVLGVFYPEHQPAPQDLALALAQGDLARALTLTVSEGMVLPTGISTVLSLVFILVFGPAVEEKLGRIATAALLLTGTLTPPLLVLSGVLTFPSGFPIVWGGVLALVGAAYCTLSLSDFRLFYILALVIPPVFRMETEEVPCLYAAVVVHLVLAITAWVNDIAGPSYIPGMVSGPVFVALTPILVALLLYLARSSYQVLTGQGDAAPAA